MRIRTTTKRFLTAAVGMAALLLFSAAVSAQENTKKFGGKAVPAIGSEKAAKATEGSDAAGSTAPAEVPTDRLALVFLFICGLLYLTYFGLKKYKNWSNNSVNKKRSVGVIDTISLGGKRFLTVTRVYDRILVLGVGEDSITLLTELKDGEEEKAIALTPTPAMTTAVRPQIKPTEHFANLLSSLTKKKQAKADATASAAAETAIL